MKILVETQDIAHAMASMGVKPSNIRNDDFDGYTDSFADALTELYGLETYVTEDLKTLAVCPKCESPDWEACKDKKVCNNCNKEF